MWKKRERERIRTAPVNNTACEPPWGETLGQEVRWGGEWEENGKEVAAAAAVVVWLLYSRPWCFSVVPVGIQLRCGLVVCPSFRFRLKTNHYFHHQPPTRQHCVGIGQVHTAQRPCAQCVECRYQHLLNWLLLVRVTLVSRSFLLHTDTDAETSKKVFISFAIWHADATCREKSCRFEFDHLLLS